MSVIKVPTNFNIDVEFEVPEFYRRFLSLMVDFLIQFFFFKIAVAILRAVESSWNVWDADASSDLHWLGVVLVWVPLLCYHLFFEIMMNGQSVGKKISGLRVVDERGGKASFSQFLIRWLLREIWFIIILLIGLYHKDRGNDMEATFLIILVVGYFFADVALVVSSKKGQRIGDLLAKTIIIRINKDEHIEDTVFMEVADNYVPSFPQIMQLSDKDINAIKSILETARKKGDFNMAEAAGVKIKAHLNIASDLGPMDFLDILLKDYNYLSVK
jgi:uncharacterized RDD family membrane protein YckC